MTNIPVVAGRLTEAEVWAACEALMSERKPITQVTVREHVGNRGSYATISKYIASWRAQAPVRPLPGQATVPGGLEGPMRSLWDQAVSQAREELARDRATLEAQRASLDERHAADQARIEQAERDAAEAHRRHLHLAARLEALEVMRADVEGQLADFARRLEPLAQLAELRREVQALAPALTAHEGRLDALTALLREQDAAWRAALEKLGERFTGSENFLQRALAEARDTNSGLRDGLKIIRSGLDLLAAEGKHLRQRVDDSEHALAAAVVDVGRTLAQHGEVLRTLLERATPPPPEPKAIVAEYLAAKRAINAGPARTGMGPPPSWKDGDPEVKRFQAALAALEALGR